MAGYTIARDLLSGFTIAFTIRSVDRSLFSHLIVIHSVDLLNQSLDRSYIPLMM